MSWIQRGKVLRSFSYTATSSHTIEATNLTGHCWAAYFRYNADPVLFLVFDEGSDVFNDSGTAGQQTVQSDCVSIGGGLWCYWVGMQVVNVDRDTFINDAQFDQNDRQVYANFMINNAISDDPPIYVGVNGIAQQVKKIYVGVNGCAQEVKAIYVGVNGLARKVYESS